MNESTQSSQSEPSKSSRRAFLGWTGTLAAGSALMTAGMPLAHAGENNTIKVALVGCGGRGTGAASNALSGALFDPSGQLADSDSDLTQVWQDYARAALTLADAGARSRDLPPIQVGSARAIVKHADEVVPGVSS